MRLRSYREHDTVLCIMDVRAGWGRVVVPEGATGMQIISEGYWAARDTVHCTVLATAVACGGWLS